MGYVNPVNAAAAISSLIEHFLATADRTDVYAKWIPNAYIDRNGKHREPHWVTVKAPLTREVIRQHFNGELAGIGTYFLNANGDCLRALIDLDAHPKKSASEDEKKAIIARCRDQRHALVRVLREFGVPFVLSKSKSARGYHFEVRFAQPLPAHVVRFVMRSLMEKAGLPKDTELFPKQDRKTAFGGQAARPGSLYWNAKTGGSVLLDPVTFRDLHISEWPSVYRATPLVTMEQFRALGYALRGVDPFGIPKESGEGSSRKGSLTDMAARPRAYDPRRGDESSALPKWDTSTLEAFLGRFGVEYLGSRSGRTSNDPNWTHRYVLVDCVFSDRHSSDDKSGAAVLMNEQSGKIGYKCYHSGCDGKIEWRHVRERLDPAKHFKLKRSHASAAVAAAPPIPAPKAVFSGKLVDALDVPEINPFGGSAPTKREIALMDEGIELVDDDTFNALFPSHASCRAEPGDDTLEMLDPPQETVVPPTPLGSQRGKERGYPKAWKRAAFEYYQRTLAGVDKKQKDIGRRARRAVSCGQIVQEVWCEHHGVESPPRAFPCDDRFLCVFCANRAATEQMNNIRATWPEAMAFAVIPKREGESRAMGAQRRKKMIADMMGSDMRGRWVEGADKYLYFADAQHIRYVQFVVKDARIATRDECARAVFDSIVSINMAAMQHLEQHGTWDSVEEFPFIEEAGMKTTCCARAAADVFPWITLAKARAAKREESAKKRGGVPVNNCSFDHVMPDGTIVKCMNTVCARLKHVPTGRYFGARRGTYPDLKAALLALGATNIEREYLYAPDDPPPADEEAYAYHSAYAEAT